MKYNALIDSGLRNLFRHDLRHHGNRYNLFCDAFSQFGIAFPSLSPIGIGAVCPKATLATYHISNPTLQLWLREQQNLVSIQRQELECLPWKTKETASLPYAENILNIEAEHIFIDERTLTTRFIFSNKSLGELRINPIWRGSISNEQEAYMLPYFHGDPKEPRISFLGKTPNGIVGGLESSKPKNDMPQVAIRLSAYDTNLEAELTSQDTYEFRHKHELIIQSGQSVEIQFLLQVSIRGVEKSDLNWPGLSVEQHHFDSLEIYARARFSEAIALDRPPMVATSALMLKAWRARYALLRNGMRGMDGEFGDELACLCTSDNTDFSCVFFWDTLFSSVAISDFHPKYARGAIRTAFVRMDPRDGSSPERKYNYTPKGRMAQQAPQSPVAAWAVRSYLEKNADLRFVKEVYPTLVKNHQFWEIYSDTDRDGLAEYRWSGQVCDNSPLWDPYAALDSTTGCGWLPPVASVALNSFLFWDANHLAFLAKALGLITEAEEHLQRAAQLQNALFSVCYVPEERRFWDYNHHTRQHRRVKTFYMFWPLFAGMEVPRETVKDLIENVLLDPNQFFGSIPFPSAAYDEATYDPKGYWRGRSWPHISYWLLQTLVRYGYQAEAKIAARRILECYSGTPGFPENFAGGKDGFDTAGFADYNWGSAAIYLIATGAYLSS